jgi:HD-like signal output (HDOD) protein
VEPQTIEQRIVELSGRGDLKIPPYPAVLARVTQIVGKRDYTVSELAKAVQSDQVLTAAVLRYANSPRHMPPVPIASLERAIMHIGANELVRCAIAGTLGQAATFPGPLAAARYRVWRDAVLGANLAQEIGLMRGLPADISFLGGLLHDFGKVVILAALDRTLKTGPQMTAARWIGIIDSVHVEAGVRAAREWRLPPALVEVIRAHHGAPSSGSSRALVEVVQIVDGVVALCGQGGFVDEGELAAVSGITPDEVARVLATLPGIVEMVASFSQPTRPASSPSFVVAERRDGARAKVDFSVSCERKESQFVYAARSVDWDSLSIIGRQALPENCLVKVTLHLGGGDLAVWMTIVDAAREGADYLIELRPYAMHGDAKVCYQSMVTNAFKSAS